MAYIFGIDGGGTRSRMRLAHANGDTVYRAEGDSTNIYSVGKAAAFDHLRALITSTCAQAGIALTELQAGCIGSAGLDRPAEREAYTDFFHSLLGQRCPVKLCNDGEILLVGGLKSTEGYSLIGGTGSLALARQHDGQMVRAGGLGYMLGDEGSACWLGWTAVRRALRSAEGRDLPTALLPPLMKHFQLDAPSQFVALMHQHFDKPHVGAAAEIVCSMADSGDALAGSICSEAAQELAALAQSVVTRMPLDHPRMILSGGVLEHSQRIRQELLTLLGERMPQVEVCQNAGTAEEGAVMLAQQNF